MNPTLTLLAVLFATPSLVFSDEMVPVSFMLNDKTPGIRVSTGDIAIKPLNYCSDLTKSAAVLYGASYHEKTGEKVENPRRVCGYTIKNGCCAFFRDQECKTWAFTSDSSNVRDHKEDDKFRSIICDKQCHVIGKSGKNSAFARDGSEQWHRILAADGKQ
ncbi:Protein of unknown function [Pyronema omphalodes CBS 100304]|uniref:Uncharacterized protein n=1 Tax=Pyronema omphalodes (strain CBS 100304) TaxID=1076935 RepID=U4L8L9_PYROM|nr:Protein of unknown function [Pyronema omphalodes CBS 100304]